MPDFLTVLKMLAGGLAPAAPGLGLGRLLLGRGATGASTALAAGLAGLVALWRAGRNGWLPAPPWVAGICRLVCFLVYLPHALAPEIQSDALPTT